ncbi:hypothetical protein E4U55_001340 [Claviceps digitariae]|nr:hypothetical protein E4U55_001340 [Claviceps digitariae]
MRIGCLQFAPQVGQVNDNISKADAILDTADPQHLDLLVLPELAFSGYNFSSLRHISPCLEYIGSGISSLWAKNIALQHDCIAVVGYPEKVDLTDSWPADPEYYNSAVIVDADGDVIGNYQKTHLFQTDETWALEGPCGFHCQRIPGLGNTALGICMDLNPYRFEAPWNAFEFSSFALASGARLVIVPMAWLTHERPETFCKTPEEPDMQTLMYWIGRLEPIIRAESNEEFIIVFANRCGSENEATYSGTSAVVGIQSGEVRLYGILGRGQSDLLVVDTSKPPFAKLVYRPEGAEAPTKAHKTNSQLDEKVELSSQPDAVTPPAAAPVKSSGNPSAERVFDMRSSEGVRDCTQKSNPSYKRNDLTIRLPESRSKLYKHVGRHDPDLSGVSGHARRRSEGQDPSQKKRRVQPTDSSAFNHHEFDRLSVNSEPPPWALLQAPTASHNLGAADRNHTRQLAQAPTPTSIADNIIIAIDSLAVGDQVAHNGGPSATTKCMAGDDPELAHAESEDPDEPFHDPTGIIGQWVQMIQTPRKPPVRLQHHGTEYGDSSQVAVHAASLEKTNLFQHRRPLKAHRVISDEGTQTQTQRSQSTIDMKRMDFETICKRLEETAQSEDNAIKDYSHFNHGRRENYEARARLNTHRQPSICSTMSHSVLTNDHSNTIHHRDHVFFSHVESEPQGQTADSLDTSYTYSRGRQSQMNKERRMEHNSLLHHGEHSETSSCSTTQGAKNASRPRLQDDLTRATSSERSSRSKPGGSRAERGWMARNVHVNESVSASAALFREASRRGAKTPVAMMLASM